MTHDIDKAVDAIKNNDVAALGLVVANGLNPNYGGGVLIFEAIKCGSIASVECLVKAGAKPNEIALANAVKSKQFNIVSVLVTPELLGKLAPGMSRTTIKEILSVIPRGNLTSCAEFLKKMKPYHQPAGALWLADAIQESLDAQNDLCRTSMPSA